ncbi:hypothetical protein SAMN04488564_102222 [Lentzea waywayandensis]|uniref:Uncharacterized protein n=1 Tax=Lentzea waywayandensis TaxID=84724 RepID=A0A1I6DCD3_9PSEU|nr:hypothetical protein [Lentzea waywayandensis]SFR02982.1 hypothetical protein SAMN04488564_102222 [Lentzea waywayandensis]
MSDSTKGYGGCALAAFASCVGMSLLSFLMTVLLAPAMAARTLIAGSLDVLPQWLAFAALSLPLATGLVRLVLSKNGRVRSEPQSTRWAWTFNLGAALLGVLNVLGFVLSSATGQAGADLPVAFTAGVFGGAVLVAIWVWDRRPRPDPITVEEIRHTVAEVDRTLHEVRAANERVHQQVLQVQARLAELRAWSPPPQATGRTWHPEAGWTRPVWSDVEFRRLRVCHVESFRCADVVHAVYSSARVSLDTVSHMEQRALRGRAEARGLAGHLAWGRNQLRAEVHTGLGRVQFLNAQTHELKHEIRDTCGAPGQHWFAQLEARNAERRAIG